MIILILRIYICYGNFFSAITWCFSLLNLMFDCFLYSLFNATLGLYVHVCIPFVLLYNICVKLKTVVITTCIYTGYVVRGITIRSFVKLWFNAFIKLDVISLVLWNHNSMGLFCILDRNGQRGTDECST